MKLWVIVLSGLTFLLLADVAVLQARLQAFDLEGLKAEVISLKNEVGRIRDWEAAVAEQTGIVVETSPSPTPAARQSGGTVLTQAKSTREVYIPLGGGLTSSQEWVNTSAQAYIDTAAYTIRAVYFEASLRANTGQVWARLINKNENEYIADSEISHNTPIGTLIRSGKLTLPAGNKLYVVQLKGETQQEAFVENARARLIVE